MNWLEKRCAEVGIETQDELAARLQLHGLSYTRSAVSHWINGTRNIPVQKPDFRRALASILRVSEPELLHMAGYTTYITYSDKAQHAAFIIDQLSPDQQELALKLLEQFLPTRG